MRASIKSHAARRGTVTVIVVAFLALFAAVALTALIASQRYATTSRVNREAMTRERDTPPQPDVLMQKVMADLLYDVKDPTSVTDTNAFKAFRGHGITRTIYGQNPGVMNTLAYAGIGRHRNNVIPDAVCNALGIPLGTPDFHLLNYTYHPRNYVNGLWDGQPGDGFVRDPERGNTASPTGSSKGAGFRSDPSAPSTLTTGDFYWPVNANYTSADENNAFLAVVDPTTGKVLLPSFHRPNSFAQGYGAWNPATDPWALNPANPNWTSKVGKYLTFRPRPNEHSPAWKMPNLNVDGTMGDVENLVGKIDPNTGLPTTQYDSLWMDMDLPVSYWKGKRYKPMVALLITPLDDRLNLNTAGNLRNGTSGGMPTPVGYSHGANQNWGPWEANLGNILTFGGDANRLLLGNGNTAGRYGGVTATATYAAPGPYSKRFTTHQSAAAFSPTTEMLDNNPVGGNLPHFYAPVDMDGGVFGLTAANLSRAPNPGSNMAPYEQFPVYGPATQAAAPYSALPSPQYPSFSSAPPYSPENRYWNGRTDNEPTGSTKYSERLNYPGLFNPYLNPYNQSQSATSTLPKSFAPSEMIGLNFRYMPLNNAVHPITGGTALNTHSGLIRSDVAKLTSLGLNTNPSFAANRFRVTTISNDLAQPGATPWFYADAATPFAPPTFARTNPYPYFAGPSAHKTDPTKGGGDYDGTRRQNLLTVLGPVDLNRPLTDYRTNTNAAYTAANMSAANAGQALADRQQLAADIFLRLRAATGMAEPNTMTAGNPDFLAAQMLAQLAVNIVDEIDHDDYITPFNWVTPASGTAPAPGLNDGTGNLDTPNANLYWVFGHELPRLVVNEALVRLENDPTEPDLPNPVTAGQPRKAQKPYKMRVWAELHNPLTPRDANELGQLADGGAAVLSAGGTAIYRMRLVKNSNAAATALLNPANTGGEPPAAELLVAAPAVLNTGVGGPVLQVAPNGIPSGTLGYQDANPATAPAFYIAGPAGDSTAGAMPKLPDTTATQANGQFDNLQYDVNTAAGAKGMPEPGAVVADTSLSPVIVLQRLANEHQPAGPYNPYVTVDTFLTGSYPNPGGNTIDMPNPISIVQDRVQITPTVDRIMGATVPAWKTIASFGKRQPYRSYIHFTTPASADTLYKQQPSEATMDTEIRHTFHRHNGIKADGSSAGNGNADTLDRPFTAMPHLDRSVNGVAELRNVSTFGSHMVMPLFYVPTTPGSVRMMYQADWLSQITGLSRAFDLLSTRGRFHGQGFGGRTPGKVNINTLIDPTILDSLTDSQHTGGTNGKHYIADDVTAVWNQFRTVKNMTPTALQTGQTKPILGTLSPVIQGGGADPQYPLGTDSTLTIPGVIRDANLNGTPAQQARTPAQQELARQELLETLVPQLTTRGNTFAVHATIGFFEVLNAGTGVDALSYPDASGNRPILGAEVLGVDGKPVRYKFFSVVDRTQLSADTSGLNLQGIGATYLSYEPNVAIGNPDPQFGSTVQVAVPVTNFTGTSGSPNAVARGNYDGIQWRIGVQGGSAGAGYQLMIDANPDGGSGDGTINANSAFMPNTDATAPTPNRNRAELVNVIQIDYEPQYGRCLLKFTIIKPHARGCNMRLMQPDTSTFPFPARPGNPGPQATTFSSGANTYRTVIPVFERIDGY